ncbi:MAG: SdiA-regulated domain-containing protein [Ginsengibacter sp.]
MLNRNILIFLFFFAKLHSYEGCASNKNKINLPCKEYDLNQPTVMKLGDNLTQISGISFYPKDSSVFAISDGSGSLFKIHNDNADMTVQWKFDDANDFEDIYVRDSSFYILASNGNIESLKFSPKGDTIYRTKSSFPGADKKKNEFESIYFDEAGRKLIMVCKSCEGDKKSAVSAWSFDPVSGAYSPAKFSLDVKSIAKRVEEDKLKLKPSAVAVNPSTKDLWILASENQLLVVTDTKGATKEVYTLDPRLFPQPEGIAFTPWGNLIISNEAGDKYGTATLLIFKPKKRI